MKHTMMCRHKPSKVMEIDGVSYHASDADNAISFCGDTVVNFTKIPDLPSATMIPELAECLAIDFDHEIMIPWPDFGTPMVSLAFWEVLHNYIIDQGWKDVCFHCAAGHGRTGTALSAMLIANAEYTAVAAVDEVRESHCKEAVESMSQCVYLQEVDLHYNGREPTLGTRPDSSSVCFVKHMTAEEIIAAYTDVKLETDADENKEDEFDYKFVDDESSPEPGAGICEDEDMYEGYSGVRSK